VSLIAIPLATLAGGLTILSPCILPIAPVVLTSALTQHKFGPLALSLGLGLSFALVGVALALGEAAFGFDGDVVRQIGGVAMLVVGALTFLPKSVDVFSLAAGPVSTWAAQTAAPIKGDGLAGQFGLGALLALVWSPCVGPTLGAAFALSSQGQNLAMAGATMLAFGLGASGALLALGYLVRGSIKQHRPTLNALSKHGRTILGVSMLVVGILVLTKLDEAFGRFIVTASPDWIVTLTTRF
jgi:cytochrome c-type biogenesis protein